MPCTDSSSSLVLHLDAQERFCHFDFAKITCGQPIGADTGYASYCRGKSLEDILSLSYEKVSQDLNITHEETRFVLYLQWDALRSVISQYLGKESQDIDTQRCRITSIEYSEQGVAIALVILPPQDLPKILPCHSYSCKDPRLEAS